MVREAQPARPVYPTSETSLYHVAAVVHEPGAKILPGSWGRIVLGRGPRHPFFYRELLLEQIRPEEFVDHPSRLRTAFAFENRQRADAFRPGEYVYRVELADPAAVTHRADITWLDVVNEHRSFPGVEDCFRRYWRGDQNATDGWEVLVDGALVVVERLTRTREDP